MLPHGTHNCVSQGAGGVLAALDSVALVSHQVPHSLHGGAWRCRCADCTRWHCDTGRTGCMLHGAVGVLFTQWHCFCMAPRMLQVWLRSHMPCSLHSSRRCLRALCPRWHGYGMTPYASQPVCNRYAAGIARGAVGALSQHSTAWCREPHGCHGCQECIALDRR